MNFHKLILLFINQTGKLSFKCNSPRRKYGKLTAVAPTNFCLFVMSNYMLLVQKPLAGNLNSPNRSCAFFADPNKSVIRNRGLVWGDMGNDQSRSSIKDRISIDEDPILVSSPQNTVDNF